MTTRIAVLGKGNSACYSLIWLLNHIVYDSKENFEISVYYDPDVEIFGAGESTTLEISRKLGQLTGISFENKKYIERLNITPKFGIKYQNWGKEFFSQFSFGTHTFHMSTKDFSDFVIEFSSRFPFVTVKEEKLNDLNSIDADYIFDCRGFGYKSNTIAVDSIPVNSVHITNVFIDRPILFERTFTKHIATEYGWAFVIPLRNRLSIGHLYNNNISNIDVVSKEKEKIIQSELSELNLKEIERFDRHINFESFYTKDIFDGRVIKLGNNSYFLEPLEANTLSLVSRGLNLMMEYLTVNHNNNLCSYEKSMIISKINTLNSLGIEETIDMINLHYLVTPEAKGKFWKHAKNKSYKRLKRSNDRFKDLVFSASNGLNMNTRNPDYGTLSLTNYSMFLHKQNIPDVKKLFGKYREEFDTSNYDLLGVVGDYFL